MLPRVDTDSLTAERGSASLFNRLQPAVRGGGFAMDGYWIWCPSVIRAEDGTYAMFASRWPKSLPFHPGWMMASEVVLATSSVPEGPYTFRQVVLPARGAQYWDGRATHNPRIVRHAGGYALFYTGISHPLPDVPDGAQLTTDDPCVTVARSSKRVGVAFAKSIYGPWERLDDPILPTRPRTFYSYLTSNPAPCVMDDGSVQLIFKSRSHQGNRHGEMLLGLARAKYIRGPYQVAGCLRVTGASGKGELEDPCFWHAAAGFELIAKDMSGALCGEAGGGVHVSSPDGLNWKLADGSGLAWSRKITWDDGTDDHLGSVERPFVLSNENGEATHLFAAVGDGPGSFVSMTKSWNICMPLAPA